jgi:hypothetical protein
MGNALGKIPKGKPVSERILLASEEEKLQQLIQKFVTAQQKWPAFSAPKNWPFLQLQIRPLP